MLIDEVIKELAKIRGIEVEYETLNPKKIYRVRTRTLRNLAEQLNVPVSFLIEILKHERVEEFERVSWEN